MQKIMIVEDDRKISELLQSYINKYGYEGVITKDFEHVLDLFKGIQPDLVLLDINLPYFDGFYWCRQIRMIATCPILFISARQGEMEQVMALEHGADDYITKPFHYEVVMAKIKSHLRRIYGEYAPKVKERVIQQSGLQLYPEKLELKLKDRTSILTKNEALLIEVLLQGCPNIVSREKMLEKVWDKYTYVDDNTLRVNVTRVRRKLEKLGIKDALDTVRGAGYRLKINWDNDGAL
ncbi:DNA-binding response regulator [Bacillus thuringiensis]|uniref:response regulator transcription factor n=1 Tax=Bacillus thuringiensis TaxID=1428 RepID=UPI000BEC3D6C|nr:response regulator transcription factor [Bacillus thuringiensis]PDY98448.1 DNA-binding response regulator [Bacillus thuringiensis]PGV55731.1 DNA-binding response regulator [Bacillus thuringiensis]QGV10637.1 response regulator [Bacillus cereus]